MFMTDEQLARLVRASQNGDRRACNTLFEYVLPLVRCWVRKISFNNSIQDQEDIVQEVLLQAFRTLKTVNKPAVFCAWLRTLTRRRCITLTQRKKIQATRFPTPTLSVEQATDTTALDELLVNERKTQLTYGLKRHRQKYSADAEVLELFYFEGYSLNQIKHKINKPLGTVKRRLYVARRRLVKESLSNGYTF